MRQLLGFSISMGIWVCFFIVLQNKVLGFWGISLVESWPIMISPSIIGFLGGGREGLISYLKTGSTGVAAGCLLMVLSTLLSPVLGSYGAFLLRAVLVAVLIFLGQIMPKWFGGSMFLIFAISTAGNFPQPFQLFLIRLVSINVGVLIFMFIEQELESRMILFPREDPVCLSSRASYLPRQPVRIDVHDMGNEGFAYSAAYVMRFFNCEAHGDRLKQNFPGMIMNGLVLPRGICTFFKRQGFTIDYYRGTLSTLRQRVSEGVPVIVLIHASAFDHTLHYVPVIGYDEEYFYLAESISYLQNCKGDSFSRRLTYQEMYLLWNVANQPCRFSYFVIRKEE